MASSLVTDVNNKVSLTLASSLVTDIASILTNGILENMALPMALLMVLPTALHTVLPMALPTALLTALIIALPMALHTTLPTALHTALSMALPTDLPIASSRVTDASDKFCSTLVSSLVIDDTNIDLLLPLLPYPNILLPFYFHCITGIDFTYLPSYIPSLLLKDLLRNKRHELSHNYITTRKYTQTIVNIAINSDVNIDWLVSLKKYQVKLLT